jgi:hypothetical protein
MEVYLFIRLACGGLGQRGLPIRLLRQPLQCRRHNARLTPSSLEPDCYALNAVLAHGQGLPVIFFFACGP